MNTPSHPNMDGIVTAIGIGVLLLGAATGSAYVMFVLAVVGMLAVAILAPGRIGWRGLFCAAIAATTAAAVACGISRF